jgi:hypothetical protein
MRGGVRGGKNEKQFYSCRECAEAGRFCAARVQVLGCVVAGLQVPGISSIRERASPFIINFRESVKAILCGGSDERISSQTADP